MPGSKLHELVTALSSDLATLEETLRLRHESMLKIVGDLRARMEDVEAEIRIEDEHICPLCGGDCGHFEFLPGETTMEAMFRVAKIHEIAGLRQPAPGEPPAGEFLGIDKSDIKWAGKGKPPAAVDRQLWKEVMGDLPMLKDGCIDDLEDGDE